ncbi:MAG: hypothetical protein HYY40_06745 [Bacteroidetes bacterium]|nr:hypothetical protein [Bacteroidota bacterium]
MKTTFYNLPVTVLVTGLLTITTANGQPNKELNNGSAGCPCFSMFLECLTGNFGDANHNPNGSSIQQFLNAYTNPSPQGNENSGSNGGCNSNNNGWDNAMSNGNNPPAIICVAEYVFCCQQNGCE